MGDPPEAVLARPARVVIVIDHTLVRHAIRSALDAVTGVRVVGALSHPDASVERITRLRPDVVLLDASVVAGAAAAFIADLTTRDASIRVVFLDDDDDDATLSAVLEAGASDHVPRRAGVADLVESVRAGHIGGTV